MINVGSDLELKQGQRVGHVRCDHADCIETAPLFHGRDSIPKGWTFVPRDEEVIPALGKTHAWYLGAGKHYCPEHNPMPLFEKAR